MPYRHGCGPSPTVKTIDTHKLYSCRVCGAVTLGEPQFGTTCEVSGEKCSTSRLTSSMADSHARTSVLRELESAWEESEADFFTTSQGLSVKQTRDLYFSKTSQQLELVASTVSRKHLPSSGMIVGGRLYQPQKLAVRSLANAGSFLPRPTAKHYGSNRGGAAGRVGEKRMSIHQMATHGLLPGHPKGVLNRVYLELVMGFPSQWTVIADWATPHLRRKRGKRLCG